LPVLSNILLATQSNRLKLAATNLELGITYWLGASVEIDGSLTVPARLLTDFVSSLPSGNLELTQNDLALKVGTAHYESTINGISSDEFPLIPQVKGEPALTLAVEDLREALAMVIGAASLDEARPVLAGIHMYVDDQSLVLVATDSYRLAERSLKLKAGQVANEDFSVIVPVRTMQELVRILSDSQGNVHMYTDANQVLFEIDGIELTSRLIEGQFPPYRQIIPTEVETIAELPTSEFVRITKIAHLFAKESAGGIQIKIQAEGRLTMSSNTSQVGENQSVIDCDVQGDDNEVSLNARYLMEALGVMKADTVSFGTSGKLSACVLRPSGNAKVDDFLYIIMPLRT
jgi:DNA polymerase-3 subunit beta